MRIAGIVIVVVVVEIGGAAKGIWAVMVTMAVDLEWDGHLVDLMNGMEMGGRSIDIIKESLVISTERGACVT